MEKNNEAPSTPTQETEKQNNNGFNYAEFGQYLDYIESQLSPWRTLEKLDDTVRQVEEELDSYNTEIMSADKETKRKMAVTTTESYILNLLARDEDFNVRILALCNKAISPAVLAQTVEDVGSDDKYTLRIIASNPSTWTDTLSRIFDLAGDEEEIQTAILENPNCNDALRFKVESARDKATA